MGSGYGGNYSNTVGTEDISESIAPKNTKKKSSIEENALLVKDKYGLTSNGYFAQPGKNARVYKTNDPIGDSIDFFEKLATGGKKGPLANGKGSRVRLDDGTWITHRIITSTKGSPAVDINVIGEKSIKTQKIHFFVED